MEKAESPIINLPIINQSALRGEWEFGRQSIGIVRSRFFTCST